MLHPPKLLKNNVPEGELVSMVHIAALCGMFLYFPFSFIYPLLLGPQTVDPLWERVALAICSASGFLITQRKSLRPWMQAFIYIVCFAFTGHLFFLVCRNDLHITYQLGYICILALVAFYLDTNFIFLSYVAFNYLLLACSLFFEISYANLFFGMIISTILAVEWLALLSRLRIMKSLELSRAEVERGAAAIQEKSRKIQSIMENIQQGVLTIEDPDGKIGAESSAYLYPLMMCDNPSDLVRIQDVLERTRLSSDQMDQILAGISCIIHEDELAFHVNQHLFPRSLVEGEGPTARFLELDWNPILDPISNQVLNLLVCIRDVTELQKLREDAAKGQQDIALLAELVNIPKNRMESVLSSSWELFRKAQLALTAMNLGQSSDSQILRMIHTLKGNARSFGLTTLAQTAHECESLIQSKAGHAEHYLDNVASILQKYQTIVKDKLGHKDGDDDALTLLRLQLKDALDAIDQSHMVLLPATDQLALKRLYQVIHATIHTSFQQILANHLNALPSLAAKLGKEAPIVQIVDPGIHLLHEGSELLQTVFLHLFNNSLDHGLESPAERKSMQKTTQGHIWIVIKPLSAGLEILFQDDGRGLDLQKIRERGIKKGLFDSKAQLSLQSIADMIFHSGFSTKDQVSEVSGRGVGLDAVRHTLEAAGGRIHITLDEHPDQQHIPFTFVIFLPQVFLAQSWDSKKSLPLVS